MPIFAKRLRGLKFGAPPIYNDGISKVGIAFTYFAAVFLYKRRPRFETHF